MTTHHDVTRTQNRTNLRAGGMPTWLTLTLVAAGLPRTVLADLNIVPPESGLLYYVLALAPFAAWLVVAIVRETTRPIRDFLVLGALYGLSLVVVHQVLWNVGAGLGHQAPAAAVSFAQNVAPAFQDLVIRGYTIMIAMGIGVGSGLAVAVVAVVAKAVRSRRSAAV
ncbi:hypothetical protein [Nonomuraea rhizosphaerae]|uniref:hypothetical protein n=1 Tax=Nonomuraea rhizosphaerae TaxID=2665663 RepID=UPI001C6041AE|nr:hypothetical protein [Nonomuraea rhizosphaerae]